jgi:hypothetical protein
MLLFLVKEINLQPYEFQNFASITGLEGNHLQPCEFQTFDNITSRKYPFLHKNTLQKLFMSKTETPCLTRNKSLIHLPSWVEVSSA